MKPDAKQRRPYLALPDSLDAIFFAIEHDLFDGGIYNVVTDNLQVQDIVNIIAAEIAVRVKFVDSPIMNQLSYSVSAQKIATAGFRPKGNLASQILETIDLLRGVNSAVPCSAQSCQQEH